QRRGGQSADDDPGLRLRRVRVPHPRPDTQVRHASGARNPHDRPRRRHRSATAAEPARALLRHGARGRGHRRRQCAAADGDQERLLHRAGLMMGLYSTALFLGAALASGLTVPVMAVVGGSWRWALGIWAIPAVLAALLWIPQMVRRPASFSNPGGAAGSDAADSPSESGEPPFRSILTDPIAWAVTGFMGLQSMS